MIDSNMLKERDSQWFFTMSEIVSASFSEAALLQHLGKHGPNFKH